MKTQGCTGWPVSLAHKARSSHSDNNKAATNSRPAIKINAAASMLRRNTQAASTFTKLFTHQFLYAIRGLIIASNGGNRPWRTP